MKFKNKNRADKIKELEAKEKKFTKNDKGEELTAEEIKARLLEDKNNRLQMTMEEGADPVGDMTIKAQIEDIKYINSLPVGYFKQFEPDPEPEDPAKVKE